MFWYDHSSYHFILVREVLKPSPLQFKARPSDGYFKDYTDTCIHLIIFYDFSHAYARADADVNTFVYAAIIIPLTCAVLAGLTLLCCLRYVHFFLTWASFVSSFASDIYFSLYAGIKMLSFLKYLNLETSSAIFWTTTIK